MMKTSTFAILVAAVSSVLFVGCGGSAPKDNTVAVKGYVCNGDSTKFYTTDGVNAQVCPQCKQGDIVELATYVCPDDQQKTVAARSRDGAPCQQCKKVINVYQHATEEELKGAGATAKKASEVGS